MLTPSIGSSGNAAPVSAACAVLLVELDIGIERHLVLSALPLLSVEAFDVHAFPWVALHVKAVAEIGAVDVVACRGAEEPLLIELKTGFSLSLIHQAVARQAITDTVYVAAP